METTTKNVQPKEIVLKKKYVRPVLVTYGRLQEFTASGTQGGGENANSNPPMTGPTFMA
jgi:hypothetical protein